VDEIPRWAGFTPTTHSADITHPHLTDYPHSGLRHSAFPMTIVGPCGYDGCWASPLPLWWTFGAWFCAPTIRLELPGTFLDALCTEDSLDSRRLPDPRRSVVDYTPLVRSTSRLLLLNHTPPPTYLYCSYLALLADRLPVGVAHLRRWTIHTTDGQEHLPRTNYTARPPPPTPATPDIVRGHADCCRSTRPVSLPFPTS